MRILVVDGDASQAASLAHDLAGLGHQPAVVSDGGEAIGRLVRENYDLVFVDVRSPVTGGLELLQWIQRGARSDTEVVIMSANGSVKAAEEAVRRGAFDFVAKPLALAEIAAIVARVQQRHGGEGSAGADGRAVPGGARAENVDSAPEVVGSSEAIARVKHMIKVSARTDANVLIYGETGTGKDLIASVIHRNSHRRASPFVKIECALFPSSLIESELYGHEEGAFTGADRARKGRFELAEGGSVYLDDVDDIPLAQQGKLLRAIEEKVFERVGGTQPIRADVRILASSKKNLLTRVGEGTFRADLYYRLDVLRIRVPPLRERREDIPAIVEHLLRRIAGGEPYRVDPQAVVRLAQHEWPGNVRELYHTLERAYLMGGGHVSAELIEGEIRGLASPESAACDGRPLRGGFQAVMQHAEKQLLLNALEACHGNKTAAAASLGMRPSTFRDKLTKHGIR